MRATSEGRWVRDRERAKVMRKAALTRMRAILFPSPSTQATISTIKFLMAINALLMFARKNRYGKPKVNKKKRMKNNRMRQQWQHRRRRRTTNDCFLFIRWIYYRNSRKNTRKWNENDNWRKHWKAFETQCAHDKSHLQHTHTNDQPEIKKKNSQKLDWTKKRLRRRRRGEAHKTVNARNSLFWLFIRNGTRESASNFIQMNYCVFFLQFRCMKPSQTNHMNRLDFDWIFRLLFRSIRSVHTTTLRRRA